MQCAPGVRAVRKLGSFHRLFQLIWRLLRPKNVHMRVCFVFGLCHVLYNVPMLAGL